MVHSVSGCTWGVYLSALEVCSRQGTIQIHVYLTKPYLTWSHFTTSSLPLMLCNPCCELGVTEPSWYHQLLIQVSAAMKTLWVVQMRCQYLNYTQIYT